MDEPISESFNSSGGTNSVDRLGEGVYRVHLPGLASHSGHVQVTAAGWGTEHCKVARWWSTTTGKDVDVRCFDLAGDPVDEPFTLTFASRTNILGAPVCCNPNGRPSAYAWANNPTAASYTLSRSFAWTRGDGWATGTRSGAGSYSVKFFDGNFGQQVSLANGNVSVTAYGTGPEICKVAWWNTTSGVGVRCFDTTGAPADSRFTVAYVGNWVLG